MPRLDELFDVKNGIASSNITLLKSPSAKAIPYIRPAKTQQRTIAGWVDRSCVDSKHCYPRHTIFVSTDGEGSHTYAYVSDFDFIANSNVSILIPKNPMSLEEKIFYAKAISLNRPKFSYGRKPKGERLKSIQLPSELPNWVKRAKDKNLFHYIPPSDTIYNKSQTRAGLKTTKLKTLFDVHYGSNLELIHLTQNPNGINFVARTSQNNGVSAKVQRLYEIEPTEGWVLTVAGGGSVLETFLQIEPFYSGRDLYFLKPKFSMSIDEMLYYATCIKANQYKYSYGRQANKTLRDLPIPIYESIPNWVNGTTKKITSEIKQMTSISN